MEQEKARELLGFLVKFGLGNHVPLLNTPLNITVSLQARVKSVADKVPQRTREENKQLLREKILGSIGGGPFELLRAFRKLHRGRGTVSSFFFRRSLERFIFVSLSIQA